MHIASKEEEENDAISRAIFLKRFTHGAALFYNLALRGVYSQPICYATISLYLCVCIEMLGAMGTSSSSNWWRLEKLVAADLSFIAELNCVNWCGRATLLIFTKRVKRMTFLEVGTCLIFAIH